jgi:Fe-S-cluster formation regulator IscX/YfhJ
MPSSRSSAKSANSQNKPKTIQRTYRFNTAVFEAFEDDCAQHLSNPKRVIEALILHWLDADPKARAAMAHKHRERIGRNDED